MNTIKALSFVLLAFMLFPAQAISSKDRLIELSKDKLETAKASLLSVKAKFPKVSKCGNILVGYILITIKCEKTSQTKGTIK